MDTLNFLFFTLQVYLHLHSFVFLPQERFTTFSIRPVPYLCSESQPRTVSPVNSLHQSSLLLLLNVQTLSLPIFYQLLNTVIIFHPTTIIWPNASSSCNLFSLPVSTIFYNSRGYIVVIVNIVTIYNECANSPSISLFSTITL